MTVELHDQHSDKNTQYESFCNRMVSEFGNDLVIQPYHAIHIMDNPRILLGTRDRQLMVGDGAYLWGEPGLIPWELVTEDHIVLRIVHARKWLRHALFNTSGMDNKMNIYYVPLDHIPTYAAVSDWLHAGCGTLLDLSDDRKVKRHIDYALEDEDKPISPFDRLRYLIRAHSNPGKHGTMWVELDTNYMY